MTHLKKYIGILALCSISSSGMASPITDEEGQDSIGLPSTTATLPAFITYGLENNYQIRIVNNQERIAKNNATKANAGYLPKVNLSGGYTGGLESKKTKLRNDNSSQKELHQFSQGANAGVFAEWTIFDGLKIQTNYKRLQELRKHSATQTRIALEDYVADITAEYYNYIQQKIRLRNLLHAVELSKERLRIVQERYLIGSGSRLSLQQAQVDFNADNARSLKQHELLRRSAIRLNEMMAIPEVDQRLSVKDTVIDVDSTLVMKDLWKSTLKTNAELIKAAQNKTLADLDFESVKSRDYPYVKLNADYAFRWNKYNEGPTENRNTWGPDFGVTVGYKLFDGNRKRERRNAKISIENAELAQRNLKLALKADLADLWQAYRNNLRLLELERENLVTAQENHFIAHERYLLGDLSGIEMREAQQNLLDAEERILVAEYNTKLCEISLQQISGNIMKYAE